MTPNGSNQQLISLYQKEDIPAEYRGTPIERLIAYQNLKTYPARYQAAELLIGICMDHRISMNLPDNFAYMIRTGGTNLQQSLFYISYAIAVGKISHIAVIGHNKCGMGDLKSKREKFTEGLVHQAGWSPKEAEQHFDQQAPHHEIGNETDFVVEEANRLRNRYPLITVVPMIYQLEDRYIYLVKES